MKIFLLFLFVLFADGANVGDFCDSNGVNGICKNIRNCPSAVDDIKNKRPPPPSCGWEGNDVVVCCRNTQTTTSKTPVLTTTKRSVTTTTEYVPKEYEYESVGNKGGSSGGNCEPIPAVMTAKKTGQKAWDKCIEYQEKYVFPCEKGVALSGDFGRVNHCHHNADELIIGGTAAGKWEFPHMVLLGYLNDQNKVDWECGGALISEKFVLTAGHCISNKLRNDVTHALIGALKRTEDTSNTRYGIKKVHKHENYKSPGKYNDIALLELDRAVPLDHSTVPACVHTGVSDPVDESRASATGWGSTVYNTASNADILQKVVLTKFTTAECSKTYEPNRHMLQGVDESTQICYGDKTKSKDTCQGDSGGPLQVKNKKIVCMYTIVGVTSFGQACGWIGVPGIYTRVSHYLPWIESVVWPN